MSKKTGFKVTIVAFVEIDKKDFGKQAAAYAMMDSISKTKKLPDDFFKSATILDVSGKAGGADIPDTPKGGDQLDPATWPLTTDALPDGATVTAATQMLDASIFQTVLLADGTETSRRISAEQDARETGKTIPPQVDDGKAAEIKAAKK